MCGSLAIIQITMYNSFSVAFWLIIAAACFDFLDGFAARLTGQYSAVGVELDSLADMISFGLVPSIAMFTLFNQSTKIIDCAEWSSMGGYICFLIVAFSALRLARFNIDDSQKDSFVGLPTPANALFCMAICRIVEISESFSMSAELIALVSVVMAFLLISPIRMFSLKFHNFGWNDNKLRFCFIVLSLILIVLLKFLAVPAIIGFYITISIITNAINSSRN